MTAPFSPTARQQEYFNVMVGWDQFVEVGFGGGRYGGKSYAECWIAFELSARFPGTVGAIFRQDSVDLVRSTMQSFKDWMVLYAPEVRPAWHMSSPIYCDLNMGGARHSRIYWMDTKDPADTQSLNLHWAQIDEASETSREFFLMLEAAVGRCVLPDGRRPAGKIGWGSNPGPGWCKEMFPVGVTPARRAIPLAGGTDMWRFFIPAWVKDNKYADPMFEARIRANYPPEWVRRWLEGDWDAFEGQVFPEFSEQQHVSRERIDFTGAPYTHLHCVDWGFRAPTASLIMTLDTDNHWWVWREYRAEGRTPEQHMPYFKRQREGLEIRADIMDCHAVDQSSGVKLWEQFRELGLPFIPCSKAKHGPEGTIFFLKELLRNNSITFSSTCAGLIKELQEARWEPQSATQAEKASPIDRMMDINDHSIDALFMGLEWWRHKPVLVPEGVERLQLRAREWDREQERKLLESRRVNPLTGMPDSDTAYGVESDEQYSEITI